MQQIYKHYKTYTKHIYKKYTNILQNTNPIQHIHTCTKLYNAKRTTPIHQYTIRYQTNTTIYQHNTTHIQN